MVTVNGDVLVFAPSVTDTTPVVALAGTLNVCVKPPVPFIAVVPADWPPMLTAIVPFVAKWLTDMDTGCPTGPKFGDTELITGVVTVNGEVIVFVVSNTVTGCEPAGVAIGTSTVPFHPPLELVVTVALPIGVVPNLTVGELPAIMLLNAKKTDW